jgi:TPR repeat protein
MMNNKLNNFVIIMCIILNFSCNKHQSLQQQEFAKNKVLAEKGDSQAQYWLSIQYSDGNGVISIDPKLSFYWSQKAAENFNPDAQYALAFNYERGYGVDKNLPLAIEYYKKCSTNGQGKWQSEAQVKLATMTWSGIDTGLDPNYVYELITKAVLQKNSSACCILGIMHLRNGFKPEDQSIAKVLFEVGADQGYSRSQFFLGGLLWKGAYIEHDLPRAAELMSKSAQQGYPDAQYLLSKFFKEGIGLPRDDNKAIEWCEKAVNGGNKDAVEYLKQLQQSSHSPK